MSRLGGCRCIITGASRGFGAAIARRFWSEGADLLLVARSEDALTRVRDSLEHRGRQQVHLLSCDLASAVAPVQIADEAKRCFGRLSVLVNNAAVQGPIGPVWDNDWEEWERTIRVNLLSIVDLSRRCLPLLAAPGGKVISIAGGGATGPRANFTAYATAKAGLVRFCETFAQEVAALGVTVNCVAPGAMNTEMTEAILAAGSGVSGEKEHNDALCVRLQAPEVVQRAVSLCVFLASSESDGITGKLISAAWDPWEALEAHRVDLQRTDVYTLRRIVPEDRGLSWERNDG